MNRHEQTTRCRTVVRGGLQRPKWICRNVKQNVVLVRDASESMRGQKAKDASSASVELVAALAEPANKDGFNVAVVDFSSRSGIVHRLEKATTLNGKVTPISVQGNTNTTAGLQDALSILEKASRESQDGVTYLRPVVIASSDGGHNEGPGPQQVANRLKEIADVVTVAFGSDADEGLMRSLASTSQHFYRCSSGRELRKFLAAVGATITATMTTGRNATQALTMIRQ